MYQKVCKPVYQSLITTFNDSWAENQTSLFNLGSSVEHTASAFQIIILFLKGG